MVHALTAAGHSAWLLAPGAAGVALEGPGAAEVERVLAWERAAGLWAEGGSLSPTLVADLRAADAALVYSRDGTLARRLAEIVPRVLTHDPQPPAGAGCHASLWLLRPLAELGVVDAGPAPCHCPTPEDEAGAKALARELPPGFLAVHPGSGSRSKNWLVERFERLIRELSPDRAWLLIEGPADHAAAAPLGAVAGAVRAQHLHPRVLGALLSRAGLYLGNDSGVTHLAAAWGAPTVALFGPTDPDVWAPVGPWVRVVRSPTGTMTGLEMDPVREATSAARAPRAG